MEEVEAGARVLARGAAAADTRWPLLRRRSPPPLEPAATPCLDIVARHLDEEKSSNPIGNMTILPFLA